MTFLKVATLQSVMLLDGCLGRQSRKSLYRRFIGSSLIVDIGLHRIAPRYFTYVQIFLLNNTSNH